jgi:YD repeat-containing protein
MMNRNWRIGLLALLALAAVAAHAGQERYDYDALGRLIRFINPVGEGTEYVYDAVGNILAVRRVVVQPPRISAVAPAAVRHNATVPVVVTGTDLLGATVTSADPGLRITGLRSSATEVSFDLLPASTVPIGAQPFTLSSSTGSAGFSLTVKPELPRVIATPATVILSPGGQTMGLSLALSNADVDAHRLALTVTDPAVASISAVTLDFPAGQTHASLTVTSGALGTSVLDLASATLAPAKVGIFVSGGGGAGDQLRLSAQVGITREPQALTQPAGPFASAAVGVIREPQTLTQPAGPFTSAAVGVTREPQALTQPTGPFASAAVGVIREPQTLVEPAGPFVSPAVGVDKGL